MKNNFINTFIPIGSSKDSELKSEYQDMNDYNYIFEFTTTKDFLAHVLNQTVPEYAEISSRKIANSMIMGDENDPLKAQVIKDHESIDKVMSKDLISFSFATKLPDSEKLMHVNLTILFRPASKRELENQLNYFDWFNFSEYLFYDDLIPLNHYGNYTIDYKYEKHISIIFGMNCPESTPNSIYLSKMIIEATSTMDDSDRSLRVYDGTEYTILGCVGTEKDPYYEKIFPILRTIFNEDLDYNEKKEFLVNNYNFNWNDYYTEGLTFISS